MDDSAAGALMRRRRVESRALSFWTFAVGAKTLQRGDRPSRAREAEAWSRAASVWPRARLSIVGLADGQQPIFSRQGEWWFSTASF